MKESTLQQAKVEYNKLMKSLGLDYNTVDTDYCEGTDGWNLKDMICEAKYQLELFFETGTVQYDDLHSIKKYKHITFNQISTYSKLFVVSENAKKDVKNLRAFINKYKKFVKDMQCVTEHCSSLG